MNAEQFLDTNYAPDLNFRRKSVTVIMDAFAFHKIEEYKVLQFAPLKKLIIQHLSLVDDKGIVGLSVQTLLNDIEHKSKDEILRGVTGLKELIVVNHRVAKETLGKAYTFFKDLTIPYEHNPKLYPPAVPDEG